MSEFEAKKRDWFLTEAVCQEQMEFYPRSISRPKVMEAIEGRNPDREHTQSLSWDRTYKYFECLILRYSAGEEVDSLRAPCKEMFEEFGRHKRMFPEWNMKYWEPDAYQYLMWLLGLAYLFNLPEYVPQIATWYAHNTDAGDDDPLIPLVNMRLLAWRIPNSELHVIDDGHLFLVTRAESVAPIILRFLAEEKRRAIIHPHAAPSRTS